MSAEIRLKCETRRARNSVECFLRVLEKMDDKEIEALFNMIPYEVADLKDTIKKSKI